MKNVITTMLVLAFTLALISCNTVEGAGKDISATGEAISNVAEDTNPGKN